MWNLSSERLHLVTIPWQSLCHLALNEIKFFFLKSLFSLFLADSLSLGKSSSCHFNLLYACTYLKNVSNFFCFIKIPV
jgi:hypothetical protein